ncbi:hypothetical protein BGC31_13125 [Komagataeibacter xylinus]|nr:hypothetical protein BFX83_13850 [Komagataeibacter xylinus]RFP03574.1 hypothetical protein BGC31_13125 [Komagataeibacter xylinus]
MLPFMDQKRRLQKSGVLQSLLKKASGHEWLPRNGTAQPDARAQAGHGPHAMRRPPSTPLEDHAQNPADPPATGNTWFTTDKNTSQTSAVGHLSGGHGRYPGHWPARTQNPALPACVLKRT